MKLLITGAAGSLGSALIMRLSTNPSFDVYATDLRAPSKQLENINFKPYDIRQSAFYTWVESISPDAVIHLASVLQIGKNLSREQAYEIDVTSTKRLAQCAADLDCKKFVTTTSGAAYGYFPRNLNQEITEDWELLGNSDYFYSDHKRKVESLLAELRISHPQMKQVTFRPGAIIGPNFDGPVVNLFKQRVITGLLGYQGLFNFAWAEDVVDYLIEAISTDITGNFNIAGDGAVSLKTIAKMADKLYLPLPSWMIENALKVLKPLGLTQYGPEQVKFIKYRPVLSSDKIRREFHHQPRYTTTEALQLYLQLLSKDAK